MRQRREAAVAGVVSGRLVVAGGWCDGHGDACLTSAEAYTGTEWTPLTPMPHAAYMATACVLNGRLYVMGGYDSNKHQVLEMTEENGLAWTVKADLPTTRYGAASVVHEGKIWMIGGDVQLGVPTASVLAYNTEADTWEAAPPIPVACICRANTIDGVVFLHADRDSGAGEYVHTCFQFRNAAWSPVAGISVRYPTLGAVLLG